MSRHGALPSATDARLPRRLGAGSLAALTVAVLASWFLAAVALVTFTVFADPCPAWEDEGTMAAPASPYAQIMCEPAATTSVLGEMSQISVTPAALIAAAVPVLVAGGVLLRRTRRGTGRAAVSGVLVTALAAPVLVVALQYSLPRDCLSGRTEAGECGRDRELR